MKKIFLFILLILVGLPGWADEWFINGNSTPIQWTDDAENTKLQHLFHRAMEPMFG